MSDFQEPATSLAQQMQELQGQLAGLSHRLEQVERRVGTVPPVVPVTERLAAVQPPPTFALPPVPPRSPDVLRASLQGVAGANVAAPSPTPDVPAPPKRSGPSVDWEALVGGRWALWLGSLCLFLALASFLALTWKSLPLPPPGVRVALGLAASLAAIGAGGWCRHRTQRWFSGGLSGAGLSGCYLSLWAGAALFGVLPWSVAWALMAATTAGGVALAVRFDAPSLSVLATLGGFLTPLLLRGNTSGASGGAGAIGLLAYVALLDAGIVAASVFKRWRGVVWLSFVATLLLLGGWAMESFVPNLRGPVFAFATLDFLLFVGAAVFYSLRRRESAAPHELLLLFANAFVYVVAGYSLVRGSFEAAPATFALALAVFFALLCGATRIAAPKNLALRDSASGLALLFLTVAVPMQMHGQWLAIGWSLEAATLLLVGHRLRAPLLRGAGQIVWGPSLLSLFVFVLSAQFAPPMFFNARSWPLLVSVLVASAVALWGDGDDELRPIYAGYATFAGAWLLAQELYGGLRGEGRPEAVAPFVVAMAWSIYALGVFGLGARARSGAFRLSALAVAALSAVVPVWTSVAFAAPQMTPFWNLRWACYLVVGVALCLLAWLSTRDDASGLSPEEVEALGLAPVGVSLFVLAGATIELYFGFAHGARSQSACAAGALGECGWRASALFAIVLLWSVWTFGALRLASAWKQERLRDAAWAVGALGTGLLLFDALTSASLAWTPIFNLRWLAFLAAASLAIAVARELKNTSQFALVTTGAALLVLWGATQEVWEASRFYKTVLGPDTERLALLGVTTLWHAWAFGMAWLGLWRDERWWRATAGFVGLFAACLLLATSVGTARLGWTPLFNARFVAFVAGTAVWSCAAWLLHRQRETLKEDEAAAIAPLGIAAALLLLWGLTQETGAACFFFRSVLGASWERWAQMATSVLWSLYGATLLIVGVVRGGTASRWRPVRLCGLTLLGMTALKVFLFDLRLEGALRIVSLAGLGAALVFISWLYSRFAAGQEE